MMMRAKFAMLVGLFAVVAPIGERAAFADASDCPRGFVCLWEDVDHEGRMVKFNESQGWVNLGGALGFNDKTRSWCNKTSRDAELSFDTNGKGRTTCLQRHSTLVDRLKRRGMQSPYFVLENEGFREPRRRNRRGNGNQHVTVLETGSRNEILDSYHRDEFR